MAMFPTCLACCVFGFERLVGQSEEKRDGSLQGGWRVSLPVHARGMRSSTLYLVDRMV